MSGAMGLAKSSILVLWLSVLVCVSSVVGARKMLFLAHDNKNSLPATLETINKCKYNLKKNHHYCCECFFLSSKKMINNNNATSFEEKRVVPTGPNPLHNK